MNYLLSEAEQPIYEALVRLCAKDEALRPFVVVDKVGNKGIFVQFATKKGVLFFDVPLLKIYLEPVTPKHGASRAVSTLIGNLGVQPDERVLIHEEQDQDRTKGEPFWKRLFA